MPEIPPASSDTLDEKLADFPGKLSPMLVKELRQGMRTNLFVIALILLQTFMILCLLAGLADPGSDGANEFFWFFIVVTLLGIQPLRGFAALSSEYQLNTMDLIQLTRLNGWRITLGKWTALNAQGLLFLLGLLPYFVIRYFLGNLNIVHDLMTLGLVVLCSALATAITIGCSIFKSIILRGILLAVFGFLGFSSFTLLEYTVLGTFGPGPNYVFAALLALAAIYGVFFFLSFGASRIASLSENHATRKRIVAIVTAILCQGFYLFGLDTDVVVVTGVILGLATIDALTEPLPIFTRVLAPFARSRLFRLTAFFLSPGWMSGLGFFVMASVLFLGSAYLCELVSSRYLISSIEELVSFLSTCNLIAFPLLIIHLFFAKYSSQNFTFGLYLFIQAGLLVLTLMVSAIAHSMSQWEHVVYLLVPIPSVLIVAAMDSTAESFLHLMIALGTFACCVIFPLARSFRSVRDFLSALKPVS